MAKFEQKNPSNKLTPISACEQSRSALVDLFMFIVVLGACGFLIYPYVSLLLSQTLEILKAIMCVVEQQVMVAPMIYECIGVTIFTASMGMLAITLFPNQKYGKPGCRGLHKPAEFDINLETEDSVNNLNSNSSNLEKYGLGKGVFELLRD